PRAAPRPAAAATVAAAPQPTAAAETAVSPQPAAGTPGWVWAVVGIAAIALLALGFLIAQNLGSDPAAETVVLTAAPETADTADTPPSVPGMTLIPGGSFTMGNDRGNGDEAPAHAVSLDGFLLDNTEVTNAAYAEFVADTGHAPPAAWQQADPSVWRVAAAEAYLVGSPTDQFAFDGGDVRPAPGTLSMTLDADNDTGRLVATFSGELRPTTTGGTLSGTFRVEQTTFSAAPTNAAFKEDGIGDFVHMHGLSGNELSLYPEMDAYVATWGQADLYLDDTLIMPNLGIHVMYSDGIRDDDAHFARRADGSCCFSPDSPGDSFLDPNEQEISIWLFAATSYSEARDFWINVYYNDVTALQAPAFTGPTTFPAGLGSHPVTHVTWDDAAAYCAWRGARLPTEAEWEYAARGPENFLYPWGSERGAVPPANVINGSAPVAVGSFPAAESPFGIEDMAGNVWEWTADFYAPDAYAAAAASSPTGPASGTQRVLRGGGFRQLDITGLDEFRTTHRRAELPAHAGDDVGFRCALTPGG
ncbi:MAG: SUMF1/EgtB/PvdO family nonheme iron enzyme, partial [Anaerolineales bacterium]|nr:SUMF1/EgtB/PvdO family nonheme iron enzyme [Anaerolineales bacterium]